MVDLAKSGRSPNVKKARSKLTSRLQSMTEQRFKELNAGKSSPDWFHDALIAFDGALAKLLAGPEEERAKPNPHLTNLGYPLTVVESILFQLNLTNLILDIPRDTVHAELYMNFARVCELHGWDSPMAHAFYERGIYLTGEQGPPVDAGWLEPFLSTAKVYATKSGLHTYRKVPLKGWPTPSYDYNFAVYKLPDCNRTKKLKIGLVSDWASGSPQAIQLIQEMKKENVDMVLHLGDTYYSGTPGEARQFFLEPMRAVFGEKMPMVQVPGNHDYYDGGQGFFDVIDELGQQEASFFCLRGKYWQILAIDTGLLDNFNLNIAMGSEEMKRQLENVMTFLPEDQYKWARHQLKVGKNKGLKTIMMSHHQLFSRAYGMGVPNADVKEASTIPDRMHYTYFTNEFETKSEALPGHLGPDAKPPVNTRLLGQFPEEVLKDVTAWYWGHEHASLLFEPYAGLERGRCIGNGAIGDPANEDVYRTSDCDGTPWGGLPEVIPGSSIGKGDAFWNLGFVTIELDGNSATAKYFQMQDTYKPPKAPTWGGSSVYFTEKL